MHDSKKGVMGGGESSVITYVKQLQTDSRTYGCEVESQVSEMLNEGPRLPRS